MHDFPPTGHNAPPTVDPDVMKEAAGKVMEFETAAGDWMRQLAAQGGEILNDEQAARLNDFLAGARKVAKDVDATRKREKAIWDERSKQVQAAFVPLLSRLERIAKELRAPMDAFMRRKDDEARAAREAARKAAAEAAEAAQRLAAQAQERGDIGGTVDAEQAAMDAEKALKAADREVKANVQSFTGGARTRALRTYRTASIHNWRAAFIPVETHPRVREAIQSALNEMIRSKDFDGRDLPGVKIVEERRSA